MDDCIVISATKPRCIEVTSYKPECIIITSERGVDLEAPILSVTGDTWENTTIHVDIENFESAGVYDFTISGGVATLYVGNPFITWDLPNVDVDTDYHIDARVRIGSVYSKWSSILTVNVKVGSATPELEITTINGEPFVGGVVYVSDYDIVVVTILNYNLNNIYSGLGVDTDPYGGSVIDNNDGTITWNVGDNLDDLDKQLWVYSTEPDMGLSDRGYIGVVTIASEVNLETHTQIVATLNGTYWACGKSHTAIRLKGASEGDRYLIEMTSHTDYLGINFRNHQELEFVKPTEVLAPFVFYNNVPAYDILYEARYIKTTNYDGLGNYDLIGDWVAITFEFIRPPAIYPLTTVDFENYRNLNNITPHLQSPFHAHTYSEVDIGGGIIYRRYQNPESPYSLFVRKMPISCGSAGSNFDEFAELQIGTLAPASGTKADLRVVDPSVVGYDIWVHHLFPILMPSKLSYGSGEEVVVEITNTFASVSIVDIQCSFLIMYETQRIEVSPTYNITNVGNFIYINFDAGSLTGASYDVDIGATVIVDGTIQDEPISVRVNVTL